MTTYPASDEEALSRVMQVVDLIAAQPDISDADAVAALVHEGVDEVDAELLVRFVPCGMSFALLKLLGVTKFPSTFQVQDGSGSWVELPLAAEHYFCTALAVGSTGWQPNNLRGSRPSGPRVLSRHFAAAVASADLLC